MHAIVLAGGGEAEKLASHHGVSNKALLLINDIPMISYVIDALIECQSIQQIVVVGPVERLSGLLPEQVKLLPETGDAVQNVLDALNVLPAKEKVMLCTSDIPMITPEALDALFLAVGAKEADLYYPIISRQDCERRYPGVKRTYVKLTEGEFTGGNIFVVNPAIAVPLATIFRRLMESRKQPLKMLMVFGIPGVVFAVKLLMGILTVAELEQKMSRILRLKGAAIFCNYPEVGTDVDKDSDLELARRVLAAGS